ncbi:MAG: hypothetical protein AB1486_18525 [Planctomycetota bacterium]
MYSKQHPEHHVCGTAIPPLIVSLVLSLVTAAEASAGGDEVKESGKTPVNRSVLTDKNPAQYPDSPDSYYVNSGLNQVKNPNLAEFAIDIGGYIPFEAFDNPAHAYNQGWSGSKPLRQTIFESFTNLYDLDSQLASGSPLGGCLPPSWTAGRVRNEQTWWNGAPIRLWQFAVNGGEVLVVRKTVMSSPPDPVHLLLINTPLHVEDLSHSDASAAEFTDPPAWPFDASGRPNLTLAQQAVERGDVVAVVKENLSAEFWVALQRTQDADAFLRRVFMPTLFPAEMVGYTYLHGGSFGAQMSGMLSFLQSAIYAGASGFIGPDIGYLMPSGDWSGLLCHYWAALAGSPPPSVHSNCIVRDFFLLVDCLGIRFDHSQPGMQPWDVAAFSLNHRPFELQVPNLHGLLGTEDTVGNWHWEQLDHTENPPLQRRYLTNTEHGGAYGVSDGINEYALFTGTEWAELLAATSAGPVPPNIPLVPSSAPSQSPYPDPYTHTLRRPPSPTSLPAGTDLLSAVDINPDTDQVATIGQGVWTGGFDNMVAGDFDRDSKLEVCFGNFDGFFHVLEVDPADPTKLVDEYKSPALGWGLYAMAVQPENPTTFWLADSLGRIHSVLASGPDSYAAGVQPFASPATVPGLYEGPIPVLARGDFHPTSGQEFLVLNRFLDWVLLDSNGQELDRWYRDRHAGGPGIPATVNLNDGDTLEELLVPALDGHLWVLQWNMAAGKLEMTELIGFTNRALYRVEPADLLGSGAQPSHLVLLGRNDSERPGFTDRLMLARLEYPSPSSVVWDMAIGPDIRQPALAWVDPPAGGAGTLVIGGRTTPTANNLQEVSITSRNGTVVASVQVPSDRVIGVETATVDGQERVLVAVGDGRIFMLDENLGFLRYSSAEYGADPDVPAGASAKPWSSNRSLGHTGAFDLYTDPATGAVELYFAEYNRPFLSVDNSNTYRVGKVEVLQNAGAWDAYELEAELRTLTTPLLTRFFRYADIDGAGGPEPYFLRETGAVFQDPTDPDKVRQFCNTCYDPTLFPLELGGYVFEYFSNMDYSVLDGFVIPKVSGTFDNGNPNDWWYPKVGDDRIEGQIANVAQGVLGIYQGSSMKVAHLPDPDNPGGALTEHIVTGTNGGLVYAIKPGHQTGTNSTPSELHYASDNLGWFVIGMDAANLDEDPEDEIVVGTWLDSGTFQDWRNQMPDRNRGHLLILDADPAQHHLTLLADLDFDDVAGSGLGITSGVLGVKIDDVNGDGTPEIWAGDAAGYLYLFEKQVGGWAGRFRSPAIGSYPGLYNNLFTVKDGEGHTIRLVLASCGYVMAFDVNWQRL